MTASHFLSHQEVAVVRAVCKGLDSDGIRRRQMFMIGCYQRQFHQRMMMGFRMAAYFKSRALLCMGHRDRYMELRLNLQIEHHHRELRPALQWPPRGELPVDHETIVLFSSDDSSGASRPEDDS